jgi:hypothetical protein
VVVLVSALEFVAASAAAFAAASSAKHLVSFGSHLDGTVVVVVVLLVVDILVDESPISAKTFVDTIPKDNSKAVDNFINDLSLVN